MDEFIQIAGISESSKDELKKVAASKANPVQRLIKTLGDIFVPIIPAIVSQRIPDGNHGSPELHGKQRLPEY